MIKDALQDFNIEVVPLSGLRDAPEQPAPLWSLIDPPPVLPRAMSDIQSWDESSNLEWSADLKSLDDGEGAAFLPFEVRYQLEVCLSREILNEHNITADFVRQLAQLSREDTAKARTILEYVAEQDKRVYDPMTIFEDPEALAFSPKTKIPHYCGYTRKATVTPSTVVFSSPTVETTNRVTRHYARENDDGRFLRVQFTDEDFEVRSEVIRIFYGFANFFRGASIPTLPRCVTMNCTLGFIELCTMALLSETVTMSSWPLEIRNSERMAHTSSVQLSTYPAMTSVVGWAASSTSVFPQNMLQGWVSASQRHERSMACLHLPSSRSLTLRETDTPSLTESARSPCSSRR